MTNEEVEELLRLAAQIYGMIRDSEDIGDCLEPSGDENACPPCGCRDCGWYTSPLRDSLIQLGGPI